MGEIVNFPKNDKFGTIRGKLVKKPTSSHEFLQLCKSFMKEEDYQMLLLAICDNEYYHMAELHIQELVESYYSFAR